MSARPNPNRDKELELVRAFGAKVCSAFLFLLTLASLVYNLNLSTNHPALTGAGRFNVILMLAVFSAIGQGLLWSFAEWMFKWDFGPGYEKLPTGMSAVVLSTCVVGPVVTFPALYELAFNVPLLPKRHWLAGLVVLVTAAVGHLAMYGVPRTRFHGLRASLMPVVGGVTLWRALETEAVYAAVYFTSIVAVYRSLVSTSVADDVWTIAGATVLSGLVFLFGMTTFILARFPKSVDDEVWVAVRGFFSGILLPACLISGMLL